MIWGLIVRPDIAWIFAQMKATNLVELGVEVDISFAQTTSLVHYFTDRLSLLSRLDPESTLMPKKEPLPKSKLLP